MLYNGVLFIHILCAMAYVVCLVSGAFQGRWIAMLDARIADMPSEAALSDALTSVAHDPRLLFTSKGALGVVVGVLLLMVAKPDLALSLVIIACALAIELLAGTLLTRPSWPGTTHAKTNVPA
jgi:hypothetical protein